MKLTVCHIKMFFIKKFSVILRNPFCGQNPSFLFLFFLTERYLLILHYLLLRCNEKLKSGYKTFIEAVLLLDRALNLVKAGKASVS